MPDDEELEYPPGTDNPLLPPGYPTAEEETTAEEPTEESELEESEEE